MAMIDYGAVVWWNGERYQGDTNYPALFDIGVIPIKCSLLTLDNKFLFSPLGDKKSWHFEYLGWHWHVKEICQMVYRATAKKGKDSYRMVFGYGIDSQKWVWNECKVQYLGKSRAKKVDKVLNEFGF